VHDSQLLDISIRQGIVLSCDAIHNNRCRTISLCAARLGKAQDRESRRAAVSNPFRSKSPRCEFCGEQTKRDGLQCFWIDTCCIKKTNWAEYSLPIRFIFRWYRNAARCYVYLSDVSAQPLGDKGEACLPLQDSNFRESEWFTRGWTLQELLAPSVVEFFSCEWRKLGYRISLKPQIHEVSTIPRDTAA
jgi:hypothetical protein